MSEKIERLLEEQNQSIKDLVEAVNKNNSILEQIEQYMVLNIRSQAMFYKLSDSIQLDIDKKMKSMG